MVVYMSVCKLYNERKEREKRNEVDESLLDMALDCLEKYPGIILLI